MEKRNESQTVRTDKNNLSYNQWNEYFSIWYLFVYLGYLTTLNNTIFYEQRYNEGW